MMRRLAVAAFVAIVVVVAASCDHEKSSYTYTIRITLINDDGGTATAAQFVTLVMNQYDGADEQLTQKTGTGTLVYSNSDPVAVYLTPESLPDGYAMYDDDGLVTDGKASCVQTNPDGTGAQINFEYDCNLTYDDVAAPVTPKPEPEPDEPEEAAAGPDGAWVLTIDITDANGVCDGQQDLPDYTENITVAIADGTATVSGIGGAQADYEGTWDGVTVEVSGSKDDDGTTQARFELTYDSVTDTLSGTEYWSWSDDESSCQGGESTVDGERG